MSSKFLDKTGLDTLWAKIKATFQTLGNLVTAWSSTPSDTKYPSEKLVKTALDGKVDKETDKGLSTNDYTTADKDKLAGIASGAEVNVQSDWNQDTTTANDYIKNKPQNLVQDASYVHTDNNYTTEDKGKVASAVQQGNVGLTDYYDIDVTTSTGGVVDNDTYAAVSASISAGRMVYLKIDDMPLYRYLDTDHGNIWFVSPYETVMISPTAGAGGHEFTLEPLADNNLNSLSENSVQNKVVKMALDGKVPTSRTVNGRELSSDISLTASDVGAAPSSHQHSTSDITSGTLPVGRGGTGKASVTAGNYLVGNGTSALAEKTPTAAANDMLSALPDNWTATPTDEVKLIRRDTGGGASFGQVTFLTVWNYIKTKIYNGSLGSGNRPVYWTGSNLALSKPSPNANLMGSVGKTTAADARADTAALANTTINCNNGSYYYLNAMKFIENVPYTFLIPSVNANKSGIVTSTKLKVYQIGASNFDLGTGATLYLDKAGGSSTLHEIVFAYRVGTTLYIFHQY